VADFIADQRTEHGVPQRVTCQALGVSESWFYKWHDRAPTARQLRRAELCERVSRLFEASGKTYGSPRIHQDLVDEGWTVSVNTVAQVMAELGLSGRKPPKRRSSTRQGKRPVARDLVRRNFDAVAPDVLWCGDMTEIVTAEGRLWCASVIDLFSRRLLGYALGEHHDAGLVSAALQMAVAARGGDVGGVIFHSDRGSEGGLNRSSQHLHDGGGMWQRDLDRRSFAGIGARSRHRDGRPWRSAMIGSDSGRRSREGPAASTRPSRSACRKRSVPGGFATLAA
jgi:putative transposase